MTRCFLTTKLFVRKSLVMVQLPVLMSQNPVSYLGDDLFQFLERSHYAAHLRDVKTDQYIYGNLYSTQNIGLASQKDIIGMTPHEVIENRLTVKEEEDCLSAWKDKLKNLLDKTYLLSRKILHERTQAIQRDIELSISGFVRITQTIRSPIFNSERKIVAIASVDYDFAQQCELLALFRLYQNYLPPKKAIHNFLRFLDVEHYFSEMPTTQELAVVLAMCQNSSVEFVALTLNVCPNMVTKHRDSLNSKFSNFDLTHLLICLRTRHERNFELWG